jgi:hypothetical protein
MMMVGMIGAFLAGSVWVLGRSRWDQIDPQDPNKVFAQEVFGTLAAQVPVFSKNGSGWDALLGMVRNHSANGSGKSGT